MLWTDFPEANARLNKPTEWTDEQCESIVCWHGPIDIGGGEVRHGFIMRLMPSLEDLNALNSGGALWQQIISDTLPPSSIFTETPIFPTPPEPRKPFPTEWQLPKEIVDGVVQLTGLASLCWDKPPAGQFDPARAQDLIMELLNNIQSNFTITPKC